MKSMEVKERGRKEIDEKMSKMGDYVKIHYLTKCLKEPLDFDTKRFVLLTLSNLYEDRKMFLEAAKMTLAAAPINVAFVAKMSDFAKAAELFVKAGHLDEADSTYEKTLACGNEREKFEIKRRRIEFYKQQAELQMRNDKRQNALLVYEKMLGLNLMDNEKKEVQKNLLQLYEKLGKIRDYYSLKRGMQGGGIIT